MCTTVPFPKETLLRQKPELFSVIKYALILLEGPWRVGGAAGGTFWEGEGKDSCRGFMSLGVLVLLSISA